MPENEETTMTEQPITEEPHGETEQGTADATDWKALARKWEKRCKENSAAAEELAAIKESQKSELEKATERADKAEAKLQELEKARERDAEIAKVAKDTGVPVEVLSGYSGDDVTGYADSIKKFFERNDSAPRVGSDGAHGNTAMTRESILAIEDPAKRKAAIAQHIDLF